MARIRSIHPGLLSDEAFMTLTVECPVAVPLLLGIWMEADDDGVFEWKPLTLKAKTLPAAMVDINALMTMLCDLNFIKEYEVDGKRYGAIRNFKHWQRPKQPKVKWPKSAEIIAYVGGTSPALPHAFPTDGEKSPQRKEEGGRMEEVKKEEDTPVVVSSGTNECENDDDALELEPEAEEDDEADKPNPSKAKKRGTRIDPNWHPTGDDISEAMKIGMTMHDIAKAAPEFRDYWLGVPGAKGVKLDWSATWRNRARAIVNARGERPQGRHPPPKPETEFARRQRTAIEDVNRALGIDDTPTTDRFAYAFDLEATDWRTD